MNEDLKNKLEKTIELTKNGISEFKKGKIQAAIDIYNEIHQDDHN